MRRCELCKAKARMHCASDQASLCWDCDAAVHSANFLVAKHSRILLCTVCQSPTSWSASGAKLRPSLSVCEQCLHSAEEAEEHQLFPGSPPEVSSSDDDLVVSRKRF